MSKARPRELIFAVVPNDDTAVSALLRTTQSQSGETSTCVRRDERWMTLDEAEALLIETSAMSYQLNELSQSRVVDLFDAGRVIDASIVEVAIREPDAPVHIGSLGYTKEVLPNLLKARQRREPQESPLTTWLKAFLSGAMQPTGSEALTALAEITMDHEQRPAPMLGAQHDQETLGENAYAWDLGALSAENSSDTWASLHRFVAALVTLTDTAVVVSVRTPLFDEDVYVQTLHEDDGWMLIEAASDAFLDPPLSHDARTALAELGWKEPGDDLPNYHQDLRPEEATPSRVSALLIETLRTVYGATPDAMYRFEPATLVRAMLSGDFGPAFAANPSMLAGRLGRLHLGLRFPHDVGNDSHQASAVDTDRRPVTVQDSPPLTEKGLTDMTSHPDAINEADYPHLIRAVGPLLDGMFLQATNAPSRVDGGMVASCWVTELPSGRNLQLVDDLLGADARWLDTGRGNPCPVPNLHTDRWVRLSVDGQVLVVADDPDDRSRAAVWTELGTFARTPDVLEALALFPFDAGSRSIEQSGSPAAPTITAWSRLPSPSTPSAPEILAQLRSIRADIDALGKAEQLSDQRPAYDDLVDRFAAAGLGVPWIPKSYQSHLRTARKWAWTTEGEPDYMRDYLMETDLSGPLPDLVTIGHAGHGINSYALTWRLTIGPVSIMAQVGWGGAIGDPSRSVGRQAELFHRVSEVIRAVEQSYPDFDPGPKMRRYQWLLSDIRRTNVIRQWDGRSMSWKEVEPLPSLADTFTLPLPE